MKKNKTTACGPDYLVVCADLHAHLFEVTLTLQNPQAQQRLALPVWIPGSYLVREFAKNLQAFSAQQNGRAVPFSQRDKCTWVVQAQPQSPLVVRYQVYAHDPSVRTAWLNTERAFFNGTSLCLQVEGQTHLPHTLKLPSPQPPWHAATALTPIQVNRRGFGTYRAADYDELADSPVELGDFWQGHFVAHGVPHRLVVAGASASFDGQRLLEDTQKICETAIRFWHPTQGEKPPFSSYLFMLNAVDDNYGGLEHRASTALICGRRDLPQLEAMRQPEGYNTLLGLISHEYFHSWNVKRLRPVELAQYNYAQENYTELLWFFEGFTSYYDDLLLRRAGLLDDAAYLKLLNKTLNQVLQAPGRKLQSVAQASFDAWIKYYRQDENTPNATISYYTKGALVALCFDLTLRNSLTQAGACVHLDQVMRAVWQRCQSQAVQAGAMAESDFAAVLAELGGRSFAKEIKAWVHGTAELPLKALLQAHGVAWHDEPAQMAQRLGLRAEDKAPLRLKTVLRGGAAEKAGMAAGDEWLAVEVGAQTWRLNTLEDLALYAGPAKKVVAWVARDQKVLRLSLNLPAANTVRLAVADANRMAAWTANTAG